MAAGDRRFGDAAAVDQLTARGTLYRAWQRVWENGGCRGVDGVTLGRFRDRLEWELDSIQDSLLRHCYRPVPLLRFDTFQSTRPACAFLHPLDLLTYLKLKAATDTPCRPSTSPSRTRSSERPAIG